tara:strand:- start:36 stop:164 length:129 start_codon:yes stop_codon:yes gene_type:complete
MNSLKVKYAPWKKNANNIIFWNIRIHEFFDLGFNQWAVGEKR